ncbi:MAG: M12 family metallopeptidase [Nannocystaceae bacterium]
MSHIAAANSEPPQSITAPEGLHHQHPRPSVHCCVDRIPALSRPHGTAPASMAERLTLYQAYQWPNGSEITIRFLDGAPALRDRVKAQALLWEEHVNLRFVFTDDHDAKVRISFSPGGSWSYIGTNCMDHAGATMNFGWLTPHSSDLEVQRVVLHEFGHMLGFTHEHQNPERPFQWDEEAVRAYYSGPPNYWSDADIEVNVFHKYSTTNTQYSAFDAASIMLYPIPNEFTIGDFEVGMNYTLSTVDKQFARMMYPRPTPAKKRLKVGAKPHKDAIGRPGEVDVYEFEVTMASRYEVRTGGTTDTVIALERENRQLIAEDDDSGYGRSSAIQAHLQPGRYTVRVWHFDAHATGDYKIWIRHAP